MADPKYAIGHRVRKHSGSWWEGKVVGYYGTEQTEIGYNVQLDMVPNGPVQIYPEAALEMATVPNNAEPTKLNRERAATAAVEANHAYGQWMPEQWLHLFLNAYERLSR